MVILESDWQSYMSEINACENLEGLKHVYSKYPSLQKQIHNAIMNRKIK
jgi:lantibiotic modifying enzyme